MDKPTRPVLRWHGGKWKLAPWIISNLPPHRIYVEPFGGAASVLMRKARAYAEVYNDLDGEVVNLFRVLRQSGGHLRESLLLTPFAREEFELSYVPSDDPIESARRLVVRSFMGFGSNGHARTTGFRSNSNRLGTTPAQDWRNYPDCMYAMIRRLQGVVIENRDARDVMTAHDSVDTVHYVDPPYHPTTRDSGVDYRHEMTSHDHADLCRFLKSLQGAVVLSGYESDDYTNLLADWTCIRRPAFADGARPRVECLWVSKPASISDLFDTKASQ